MKGKTLKALIVSLIAAMLAFIPVMTAPQTAEAASNDNVEVIIEGIEYKQSAARKQAELLNAWRASKQGHINEFNTETTYEGEDTFALQYDYTLEKLAMDRAAELVLSNAHERPVGDKVVNLPKEYSSRGENLASNSYYLSSDYDYADRTLTQLKEEGEPFSDQGHRRIMQGVPRDYNAVGISIVKYKGVNYCVQIFSVTSKVDTKKTSALDGVASRNVIINKKLFRYQDIDFLTARIARYDWYDDCDRYGNPTYSKIKDYITVKKNMCSSIYFDDVQDTSKYYYVPVNWALKEGVTNGSGGNNFSPGAVATREQAVTFIYNYAGKPKVSATTSLKDISNTSSYAVNAVKWAKERKLTTRTDNMFYPKNNSTRAEMVTFLWRLAGSPNPTIKNPFTDVAEKDYYYKAVVWAKEKKVTSASGKFSPNASLSRAEAVTFVYNYHKNVNKK